MTEVCKSAAVSTSSYYVWCHDQRFCEWLLADWSRAMLMEGMHSLNVARAMMSQSPQYLRIIVKLLFDPRGLAGLQAWRNAATCVQPDFEPAQPLAGENWTMTQSPTGAAPPPPTDRPAPAPAPPRPNRAYARISRTCPEPPPHPATALLHLTRAVRSLKNLSAPTSAHACQRRRTAHAAGSRAHPPNLAADPVEATRTGEGAGGACTEQSGRPLPPSAFRPQPDPRGAGASGREHREGVRSGAAAPPPPAYTPPTDPPPAAAPSPVQKEAARTRPAHSLRPTAAAPKIHAQITARGRRSETPGFEPGAQTRGEPACASPTWSHRPTAGHAPPPPLPRTQGFPARERAPGRCRPGSVRVQFDETSPSGKFKRWNNG
ncbi:MAG: hypothetical protein ACRD1M_09100 [Terriglobales bacterium]